MSVKSSRSRVGIGQPMHPQYVARIVDELAAMTIFSCDVARDRLGRSLSHHEGKRRLPARSSRLDGQCDASGHRRQLAFPDASVTFSGMAAVMTGYVCRAPAQLPVKISSATAHSPRRIGNEATGILGTGTGWSSDLSTCQSAVVRCAGRTCD